MKKVLFPILLSISASFLFAEGEREAPKVDLAVEWSREGFWSMQRTDFLEMYKAARFESDGSDLWRSNAKGVAFFDFPVYESLVRFEDETPTGAAVSIYNRGDAGDLKREEFAERIQKVKEVFTRQFGMEPTEVRASGVGALDSFVWKMPATTATLEWSFTREVKSRGIPFRGEFIRLRLEPVKAPQSLLESSLAAREATTQPVVEKREPERDENGDVILKGVPMVDQGQKGYCAVASAERVMRYYGREVDQHELAQIASSSAAEGTSSKAMVDALKKMTARLKVRFRSHYEMNINELRSMLRDYNREARRVKAEQLDIQKFADYATLYASMAPHVLVDARVGDKTAHRRFLSDIKSNIDSGTPLLWALMLGVVPEEKVNPQGTGGHMRLIIGYNEEAEEIIYSDSWGAGHEEKRMRTDKAWAVTTALHTLEPF